MNSNYEAYVQRVEEHRTLLEDTFAYIWNHPEVGYKEWRTSDYLANEFEKLGYQVTKAGNIPGFIAELDTGVPGPKVAIMGELDALFCKTHPQADKETGAVHACGHLIQVTAMLGAAAVMKADGALKGLSGSIRFVAVPAEETIDLEYRTDLIEKGIIHYVAGKIEFLYRGLFDGVDMAIMFHADSDDDKLFKIIDGMDGCLTKHIEYKGVAAHAGGAPDKGINALYAATLGLQATNAIRETFLEEDYIRYHPVITSGSKAANIIPDLVKMDTYVRASKMSKMIEVNQRINRALAASAAALGANVIVDDRPGNLPFHSDKILNELCRSVMTEIFGEEQITVTKWDTQSSDIGDLSSLIPVIQPLCMGAVGLQHGEDYYISDHEKCIMNPTKVMICMIYELLKDDARKAAQVIINYQPIYQSKEAYFKAIDALGCHRELVEYQEGQVVLKI